MEALKTATRNQSRRERAVAAGASEQVRFLGCETAGTLAQPEGPGISPSDRPNRSGIRAPNCLLRNR